ncbi:MAG: response regulator, partial [Desulfovermiculus sp.]
YAGATIMGDGHVALILDVAGLAQIAELSSMTGRELHVQDQGTDLEKQESAVHQSLLTFFNAPKELCALPLDQVSRVERIKTDDIEMVGGKKIIQYRTGALPLYALEEVADVGTLEDAEELIVIVFTIHNHVFGLLASPPVDTVEAQIVVDRETLRQTGIIGSTIIRNKTALLIEVQEILNVMMPHGFSAKALPGRTRPELPSPKYRAKQPDENVSRAGVLLAEDSEFFRNQVQRLLQDHNYCVFAAEDGQAAWETLQKNPQAVHIVLTDLEMPNVDGFELTRKIKQDDQFTHLPVIALTSLAGEKDEEKGQEVGIDEYQVKLDQDQLLYSLANYVQAVV